MKLAGKKLELLVFGARLKENRVSGRQSGAGPAGGSAFELRNNSIINLPLWTKETKASNFILKENKIYTKNGDEFLQLKKINEPKFYNLKTSTGVLMKKIALLHGKDCLATTIFQRCMHWRSNLKCKFCAIEISLQNEATTSHKTKQDLLEVIEAGINEGVITHCTFTTGTLKDRKKEVDEYIDIVKFIRKNHDIPIHVQLEPIEKKALESLKSCGIDSIGIHIENFDEKILENYCPGKFNAHSIDDYKKSWLEAAEIFGKNQVSSFILLGMGEDLEKNLKGSIDMLKIGVIPFIVPVRPLLETDLSYRKNINFTSILEFYERITKSFKEFGVDPNKNKAGCVRCNACSAIKDFYNES